MKKQELINELKFIRGSYSNEDRFRGGVRTGLGIALGVIDKLDEPEIMVIPKFVADHIELCKSRNKRLNVALLESPESEMISEMGVNREEANEIYARAWLDGYEIEKESLYYVKLPNTNSISEYLYLAQGNVSGDCWFNSRPERLDYEAGVCKHKFTEKEIKAIDERYWTFAVEAKE